MIVPSRPPTEPKRPREESLDQAPTQPSKLQRIGDVSDDEEVTVIDEDSDDDDHDPGNGGIDTAELDEFDELEDVLQDDVSLQEIIGEDLPVPTVEASGLVRVGPQPAAPQQMVISAPRKIARRIIGHRMTVNHEMTDRHIPGCDRQALFQERKDVIEWVMSSLQDS